jgi:hypothetical protein
MVMSLVPDALFFVMAVSLGTIVYIMIRERLF